LTRSEQERRAKAEEARSETERILAAQAADLEAKKAEMARRDAERENVKAVKVRACTCASTCRGDTTMCLHAQGALCEGNYEGFKFTPVLCRSRNPGFETMKET